MDIWTASKRSEVMASVRPKGNLTTEIALTRAFRRHGITGWRRHLPIPVAGRIIRPDFVFQGSKMVVFVDGCFWHQCPWHATQPASKKGYWLPKLEANKARDRRVTRVLRCRGWHVLRIWEHSIRRDTDRCVSRVKRALSQRT